MARRTLRLLATAAVLGGAMYGLDRTLAATTPSVCGPAWVAAWHASPVQYDAQVDGPLAMTGPVGYTAYLPVENVTFRLVVMPHASGSSIRFTLSNHYGAEPLRIGAVTIADRGDGSAVVASTLRTVTFRGSRSALVGRGQELQSDPITQRVVAGRALSVSVFVRHGAPAVTRHIDTRTTSFVATSDATGDATGDAFTADTQSSFYLTAVDVLATHHTNAVVAVGDSITDGTGTTVDADKRWTDALEARLNATEPQGRMSVVNGAISGNFLLTSLPFFHGSSAVSRFAWDIAPISGLTDVILHEGTNDIAWRAPTSDTASIVGGLRRFADEAHAKGLRVFATTILPTTFEDHGTARAAVIRTNVNRWIRQTGPRVFDGVFDFAAAVTDPANPTGLLPAYDAGDHLHVSDAGQEQLASAVKIGELSGSPCLTSPR